MGQVGNAETPLSYGILLLRPALVAIARPLCKTRHDKDVAAHRYVQFPSGEFVSRPRGALGLHMGSPSQRLRT